MATGWRWIFLLRICAEMMWTEFSAELQFTPRELELLVDLSEGFSGSDIREVCVRLRRRRITKQQFPEMKDAFQVLQNIGIGEGEGRRFLSLLRGKDRACYFNDAP